MLIWKEKCNLFEKKKKTWQNYVHALFLEDDETFNTPKFFDLGKKTLRILTKTIDIWFGENI
jgi:hypothetical protein